MQIFKNRPLFCACMAFIASAVAFAFVLSFIKIAVACLSLITLAVITVFALRRKIRIKHLISVGLCCVFIMLSAAISTFYFDHRYQELSSLPQDKAYKVEALILDEAYAAGASSEYTILVTSLDEEKVSFKANLECEYLANIQPGNEIHGYFSVGEFEEQTGAYREKDIMLADGIFVPFLSDAEEDMSVYIEKSNHPLAVLSRLNSRLSYKLINSLGDDVGGVSSAIFLGNKKAVPTDVTRDFRRAGASHILAISGLHMSIIFGALAFMLKKMFVPYKARAVILSFLAVFYLAFTGFSISATRSIIMLLIVYLSMICSYSADSLTSLSVAGALILGFSPCAVMDAGFWMSFGATFGILVYMQTFQNFMFYKFQPYYKKWGFITRPFIWITTLILTSLCAIAPLVIVFCVFTREMSLFSVLSSLALSLPTEAVLILTPLYLLFMKVPVVGRLISIALTSCTEFMIDFCRDISLRDDCMLSLDYDFSTPAAIILGIILFLCLALKFKRKYLSPLPFVLALTVFFVAIGVVSHQSSQSVRISYVNQASDRNVIVATNGDEAVLFDMTPGYYSSLCYAYEELGKLNVTEIDSFVLTKYTTAHIASLSKSFKSQMIRKLYIPKPESNDDYFRMTAIMECAKDNGVIVDFYTEGEEVCFIDGLSTTIKRETLDRSTAPVTMLTLEVGDESLTYLSSSYIESSIASDVFDTMESTEHLIFGSRGPTPKQTYKIQNGINLETVIFSSDKVAAYYDRTSFVAPTAKLILSPEIYRFRFPKD